jgi:hypothetical protein
MAMIETDTFRLTDSADIGRFLDADRQVQTELMLRTPTFLRRTTARGHDGEWLVVVLWGSGADADASRAQFGGDPAKAAFMAFVDEATLTSRRYETLD